MNQTSRKVESLIAERKIEEAIEVVKPLAEKDSDDQLLYLLDYGLVLQLNGQIKESNEAFLAANDIAEIRDYTSITREAGSFILNDGLIQYKGDDFEKILINVFLAINFAITGDIDSALVEARRINEKLLAYKEKAKRDYPQNAFARYLAGMLYEEEKNWDSSYIDYEKAYEINPAYPGIGSTLIESSARAGRWERHAKWIREFPEIKLDGDWRLKKNGELVVIFQQGRGPIKKPDPSFRRIPRLYPRYSSVGGAKVLVYKHYEPPTILPKKVEPSKIIPAVLVKDMVDEEDKVAFPFIPDGPPLYEGYTQVALDIENIAIRSLETQKAGLIAKRIAGIVAKEVVADQIRQKNETLGAIAWVGMFIADQADLRQWLTLPESIQTVRLKMPPGKYDVILELTDGGNVGIGKYVDMGTIEVKRRRKTFLNHRSL